MLLSIIIPVYNVEEYIYKCLESIFNNFVDPNDYEIIIINDGTTDNSMRIIETFAKKYKNLRIFSQKNEGLGSARNKGLELAIGKYIWFIDSDDWLPMGTTDYILQILQGLDNIDGISINYKHSNNSPSLYNNKAKHNQIYTGINFLKMHNAEMPVQYYIIKQSIIKNNNITFKANIYHEDVLFTNLVLWKMQKLLYTTRVCYIYNLRPNSIMSAGSLKKHAIDMLNVACTLYSLGIKNTKTMSEYKTIAKSVLLTYGGVFHYGRKLNTSEKQIISARIPKWHLLYYSAFILNKNYFKLLIMKLVW